MSSQTDGLRPETIHSLLADSVRKQLLQFLSSVGSATVREFAKRIVARQRETASDFEAQTVRSVVVRLVHNHLPRLAEHDVVDYDRSRDRVAPGANFDVLEPYVSE